MLSLCLLLSSTIMSATERVVLENSYLKVHCSSNGLLSVYDKRCGKWWNQLQSPGMDQADLRPVDKGQAKKGLTLRGAMPALTKTGTLQQAGFQVELTLQDDAPSIRARFIPETDGEWSEVFYPAVFYLGGQDSYVLFPHAEGVLAPVRRSSPDFLELGKDYICSGLGTYCACMGLVDLAEGYGMLYMFDDPELAGYEMVHLTSEGFDIVTPRFYWRASKYRFDRPWALTMTFANEGGYVALAGHYRRFYESKGYYRSLKEKAAKNATVDKLVGAPVFWLHKTPADVLEIAEMMKQDGIDRAVLHVGFTNYSVVPGGEEHEAALEGVVKRIRDMGYVVSRYDQYRDCFKRDENASPYHQINLDAYPDMVVRNEDGSLKPGWPPGYVINPVSGLALARNNIPNDLKKRPYNGRFIDCMGTVPVWEGEDWNPKNLLDVYGSRKAREELLDYVGSLGLVIGTEGGIDFFLSRLHWLETPMSLVRWTAVKLSVPGWDPVEDFLEYRVNIGVQHRIPFFSLVHHSEVMITWRWEDGFSRLPRYWQDKNLWSVLYGNPPMFFINKDKYLAQRGQIARCNRYVCGWTRRVGYADLTSHRFVTSDRNVQESVFSTGDRVVVNFGDVPYRLTEGTLVPPRDYVAFDHQGTILDFER